MECIPATTYHIETDSPKRCDHHCLTSLIVRSVSRHIPVPCQRNCGEVDRKIFRIKLLNIEYFYEGSIFRSVVQKPPEVIIILRIWQAYKKYGYCKVLRRTSEIRYRVIPGWELDKIKFHLHRRHEITLFWMLVFYSWSAKLR